MAILDYETLMLPLLRFAAEANGQEVPFPVAVGKLADQFNLTDEERQELLPSGGTFKSSSRGVVGLHISSESRSSGICKDGAFPHHRSRVVRFEDQA